MPSKHYKWHTRWRVDLASGVCTHDSGLRVQISADGASAQALNWPEVERVLAVKHGHNTAAMGRRLLDEARRVFTDPRTRWNQNPARIAAELAAADGKPIDQATIDDMAAYCDELVPAPPPEPKP